MKKPSPWSTRASRLRKLGCAAIVFCCLLNTSLLVAQKVGRDKAWQELVSTEGRFRVLLPDTPEDRFVPVPGQIVNSEMHAYFVRSAVASYVLAYADFPKKDPRLLKQAFDNARARALADGRVRLISEKDLTTVNIPGREFVIDDGVNVIKDRLYYSNGRLYQVMFIAPEPNGMSDEFVKFYDGLASKFFDSFKIGS